MAKQRFDGYEYFIKNETDRYPLPATLEIEDLPQSNEIAIGGLNYTILKVFRLRLTPPTLFLFFLIALFSTTAVLHGAECLQLVHGMWYLLCLPSGYIFLMVYSIVNITDRSWGTREGVVKKAKIDTDQMAWYHKLYFKWREVFFCCFKDERDKIMGVKTDADDKSKAKPEEDEPKEKKQVKMTEESTILMRKASRKGMSVAPELQGLLERDEEGDFDDQGFTLTPVQELPEPIPDDLTDEEHLNEEVRTSPIIIIITC